MVVEVLHCTLEDDIWIAATALQHSLTIITQDRHFSEISNLQIVSWAETTPPA